MNVLRLLYEPEDEWHGQLHASAEAFGFSGRSSAWFGRDDLVEFRRHLGAYPLLPRPAAISGGVGVSPGGEPRDVHIRLTIAPFDTKGGLLVRVELACEPPVPPGADCEQRAHLCFPTDYASLDRFRIALGPMLDGGAEAILVGI
ncbi:hypothetical protein GCM10009416_45580 [Craurococcus roseus]|uniref:Uncharacterized protein n=1 Tax=Craurococcus roseus TaxID=77585 RepID=A0ABP3R4Y7_9PROT